MAQPNVYAPSAEFASRAHVSSLEGYRALYDRAAEKPEEFWGELAERELAWFEKWSHVFEWNPPFVKWFVGGKINASYNCVDRHLGTHRKNKVAILWEGEPGDQRQISYQELHRLVCRFANVLKGLGLKSGDRAILYMGMVPELPVALLACARHRPQRGIRRVFGRGAEDPDRGPGSGGGHYLRRGVAARQGSAAEKSRG
jgi:acetyl-CoA synthetase